MNKKAFFISLTVTISLVLGCFSQALANNNQPRGWQGLVISQIFPNPEGKDKDKEWIKLYNSANTEIDLQGWIISDNYGHISPYFFANELWLEDDDYIIIERKETNIILNNFLETLSLFSAEGELADQVSYVQAPKDSVYSYQDGTWLWKKNIIKEPSTLNKKEVEINGNNLPLQNPKNNWDNLFKFKNEEIVTLSGIVISLPNQLASQYFLLSKDNSQSQIVQVYSYKKEFPTLEIGDNLEVYGRYSSSSSYFRLKTDKVEDIKKSNNTTTDIAPLKIYDNLKPENIGKVFSFQVEIIKVKKNSLSVLSTEEKTEKQELELDTQLMTDNFSIGQILEANGILLISSENYILKIIPEYGYNIYSNNTSSASTTPLSSQATRSKNIISNKLKIFFLLFILSFLLIYLGKRKKISLFDL